MWAPHAITTARDVVRSSGPRDLSDVERHRMPPAAPYTLILLGEVDSRGRGGDAGALCAQSKVVALLARLSLPAVGRFVRRDTLVGLLWPELEYARARRSGRRCMPSVP